MATIPQGWKQSSEADKSNIYEANVKQVNVSTGTVPIVAETNKSNGSYTVYSTQGINFIGGRQPIYTVSSSGARNVQNNALYTQLQQSGEIAKLDNAIKPRAYEINQAVGTPSEQAAVKGSQLYKSNSNTAPPEQTGGPAAAPTSANGQSGANQGLGLTQDQATENIGRDVGDEKGTPLRYPLRNTYQGDYLFIEMRTYQKSGFQSESGSLTVTRMEDRKHTPLRKIYLPIQSGIVDSISVDWGQGEINPITAQFASLAMGTIVESGRSNPLEAGKKFIGNFSAIADKLLGPNATPDMQKLVANYFTEQAVGTPGLLSRSIGGAINNNLELLFNGPTLRSFTFNFKLTPREPDEAEVIKQIIRVFKKGMSPALSKSGLFLSAPNVFKLKYIYTDKGNKNEDHPYLNKIKVAALRDFSVSYTPDGNYMTYDGGSMTQYDLSMTFGEIDPVYAQDYDDEQGKTGMGW